MDQLTANRNAQGVETDVDLRSIVAGIPGIKVTHFTQPENTLGSFGILRFEWNGDSLHENVPRTFIHIIIDVMLKDGTGHFKVGAHTPGMYSINWLYKSTAGVCHAAQQVRDSLTVHFPPADEGKLERARAYLNKMMAELDGDE
jgi:hypothetical protein